MGSGLAPLGGRPSAGVRSGTWLIRFFIRENVMSVSIYFLLGKRIEAVLKFSVIIMYCLRLI